MKRIYALTPGAWQTAVAQTLDRPPFRRLRADLRELWEKDVGLDRRSQYKKSKYYLSEPAQEAVTTLETRMNEPLSSIEKEIRSVVAERERHARATGDAYPLVFAASKLGLELLKRNWAASEVRRRGEVSIWLASLAIKWDPNNPMGWVVWRDALAAAGDQDMAERIGWAAIKRFPEDLKMRNQLARLLARNTQRQGEAEALLLETISRFPRDEYCRNQLAHLLVDNRRWTEAEIVLRKAHEELGSAVAANQLADLISRRGRSGQAEQLLRDTIAQAPHSSDEVYIHSRNILARLMSHDPSRDEETVRELLETIELSQTTQGSARNQLAFILSRAGKREEARKILDETLRLPMMTLKDRTTAQAYLKALSTGDLPEAEEFWAEAEEAGAGAQPERGEDSAPDDKMDYLAAAGAVLSDFLEPGDARERALETGQDPESQRESAAEPPPEKRSGARSESESESEKTAPSPDRGDGVPPASASKPAAAAHGAGETPRQGVVESRLPESAPPLHVQMAAVAGRQGELRRLTTLVMRKKGQERQRMAEALMRDAPGDLEPTYQEFVRRWVFGMETDRPTPDTFTISFIDALRRGNVDKLGELQNSHRSFRQLTDMARAVLIQDKEAAERTFSWLKRSDVAESRAVVALRKLTMLRLSEPPADADDMLKALAQNDNVIADLEEAALAEADMLLAA
ncbi:MAG TPA: tetratricopeptide repeat protein [Allosphingosinicella sp.]